MSSFRIFSPTRLSLTGSLPILKHLFHHWLLMNEIYIVSTKILQMKLNA